jgi:diaminopimelate decarboxylase
VADELYLASTHAVAHLNDMTPTYRLNGENSMLGFEEGHLCFQGKRLKTLADELGTPFFLFSEIQLRSNYDALVQGLSQPGRDVKIRYCAKTNNEAELLSVLASCGSGIMVSHPVEAQLALQCGFDPSMISYQRPFLLEEEVREIMKSGISFFHAYRRRDLEVIEMVASDLNRKVDISLRLRNDPTGYLPSPLVFFSRRLGFQDSEILPAVRQIRESNWLTPAAINFYIGTQRSSPAAYRPILRRVARLGARIQSEAGITLKEVNCGGGIPSPSLRRIHWTQPWRDRGNSDEFSDSPALVHAFAQQLLREYLKATGEEGLQPPPALAIEPGRSIMGNAAILVTRVRAVQGNWLFLDASQNYLGESRLLFRREILPAVHPAASAQKHFHFSGNTLNTMDCIGLRQKFGPVDAGDVVVLCDAGAYSLSRAQHCGGLTPAVYLLQANGDLRKIRRAETISDLTSPAIHDKETGRSVR